jgi:hypothetical protein
LAHAEWLQARSPHFVLFVNLFEVILREKKLEMERFGAMLRIPSTVTECSRQRRHHRRIRAARRTDRCPLSGKAGSLNALSEIESGAKKETAADRSRH